MEIITGLAILSAILVVTSISTVYSVLWLVGTFIVVSLLLGLLNLGFPALLYIIVYVGAIAILFLFVVQLLDLGNEDNDIKTNKNNDNHNTLVLSILFAISVSILITITFQNNITFDNLLYNNDIFNKSSINLITYNNTTPNILFSNNGNPIQVSSLAEWLYGPGLLPLIVVSIILLVSMVAPISLCKE